MAFQSAARPDQQPESVVEAIPHLGHRHRNHPRRGQLDCLAGYRRGARQISTTAAGSGSTPGETASARSRNSVAAADSDSALVSSDGTGHSCSSVTRSPSRLVARIFTVAEREKMASTMSAAAFRTCSQLSNTSSRERPSNAAATLSVSVIPGCWVMPSTAATASGTAAGSVTAASSITHTPSGKSGADRAGHLECESCLAHPADTGKRDQPVCLECGGHIREFGFPADQAGGR